MLCSCGGSENYCLPLPLSLVRSEHIRKEGKLLFPLFDIVVVAVCNVRTLSVRFLLSLLRFVRSFKLFIGKGGDLSVA